MLPPPHAESQGKPKEPAVIFKEPEGKLKEIEGYSRSRNSHEKLTDNYIHPRRQTNEEPVNQPPDPWKHWLERHGPALLLAARQWTSDRAAAEDAVQDGFVRFWKTRDRADDRLAYLYACVRSAAFDLARSANRRDRRERVAARQEQMLARESDVERDERRALIERALAQLPLEQREIIVMKIWGELTFWQIAEALKIGTNTVASRYRYAIEKLSTGELKAAAYE